MADYETEKTHKELPTKERVIAVLFGDRGIAGTATPQQLDYWVHRTHALLAGLVDHLERRGLLDEADLDRILHDVAK